LQSLTDKVAEDEVAGEGEEDFVPPDEVIVNSQNLGESVEHPSKSDTQQNDHEDLESGE
jgi:hypothetical protein